MQTLTASELNPLLPAELALDLIDGKLTLFMPAQADAGRVCVDFTDSALLYRVRKPALGSELLIRAMGGCRATDLPSGNKNTVFDATAGLGTDAFLLACAGWHVTLCERSPVVHALLQDGLQRARQAAQTDGQAVLHAALQRMTLQPAGSSLTQLGTGAHYTVVYLDPMFPEREKTARVKKNRFILQRLHGAVDDADSLLLPALQAASKVVVKRPRLAPCLAGHKPSGSVSGRTSRFDIYAGLRPSQLCTG